MEIKKSGTSGDEKSLTFPQVFEAELQAISQSRIERKVLRNRDLRNDLIGLAFSGGGIRSATFNLGILQALAKDDVLRFMDYLSTVSGGGYIGSWLSSWAYHLRKESGVSENQISEIQLRLNQKPQTIGDVAEPHQIHFLRKYSNYLTPRLGLLSGDTLAFVSTYIRNLVLNQTILISALFSLLLIPRVVGAALLRYSSRTSALAFLAISVLSLFVVVLGVVRNTSRDAGDGSAQVKGAVAVPQFIFCVAATLAIWQFSTLSDAGARLLLSNSIRVNILEMSAVAVFYAGLWLVAAFFDDAAGSVSRATVEDSVGSGLRKWAAALWGLPAGFLIGGLGLLGARMLAHWQPQDARSVWYVLTFGVPTISVLVLLAGVVHLGFIGRAFQDSKREWWARLGGIVLSFAICWFLLSLVTLFVPLWLELLWARLLNPDHTWATRAWQFLSGLGILSGVGGWIGLTAKGLSAARSSRTGPRPQPSNGSAKGMDLDRLAQIGPPVFAVGLVILLSLILYALAPKVSGGGLSPGYMYLLDWNQKHNSAAVQRCLQPFLAQQQTSGDWNIWKFNPSPNTSIQSVEPCYVQSQSVPCLTIVAGYYWLVLVDTHFWKALLVLLILYGFSRLMGFRVDVNEFSLHNAYRNRLVRCYLGATNPRRRPQPFTGFDENDNIYMHELAGLGIPFHIVNATLNVVKGKELALQARKARSFTFTPLYSGFDYTEDQSVAHMPDTRKSESVVAPTSDEQEVKSGAFRLSATCSRRSRYPGVRLGTAMAISGAAVSPNMGHYTTGAVSFLLTVFSVRLGWWLGNPLWRKSWESGYPRSSWRALVNELTGDTNEDQNEIYLSDGGHFDNLGLYELVHRRCRLIVVSDAGADISCTCDDLAAAIEKCRVDFATQIDIDLNPLRLSLPLLPGDQGLRVSSMPFTMGKIYYPSGFVGTLIYIKPSLNTDLPKDVLAYARLAVSFPHQSTIDQFFDEAQFESYRALGFACGSAAVSKIREAIGA